MRRPDYYKSYVCTNPDKSVNIITRVSTASIKEKKKGRTYVVPKKTMLTL